MAFEVWAPRASRVRLSLGDEVVPMTSAAGGWWAPAAELGDLPEGTPYGFLLDDDPNAAARPAFAPTARRCARAVGDVLPR